MSYLEQSLDAALLSNATAVNAAGSNGAIVGSLEGAAGLESAQPDSKSFAKEAQGLATSDAIQSGTALPSGSKAKLSATNLKIYAALAPFDGVELSGSALFSLAEDKKWFTSPETKIFECLQEVGRCSLDALKRMTGVRASTLTRVLSFFEHLELIKLSANEVCLLKNQPVDFAQPVVNRAAVKEAKIAIDLKAICDRSLKLFNNIVFEALRKFKAINVLDLRAFSGVSPARFLSCCGQLLATGKAVYRAGVLYWAPRGLQVKPRPTRKPPQETPPDDIEPDDTCTGGEGQGHGEATKGSALSPKGATVASGTTANMSVSPAESQVTQVNVAIDIDLDQVISLSDRMSPCSVSPATSSFVLSFDADAQAAMDPVKAPFSQEPQEVPALASSFEKSVTPEFPLSGSAFPPMVRTALCTVPDMWLEFATYSGCTLVEPVERGYDVWDIVHNKAPAPISNIQLGSEPVVANQEPCSLAVAGVTHPLDQNADIALVPEMIEEDEEIEVAPTDTCACHVGNATSAGILAQELSAEQVEPTQQIEQTILVPQGEPHQVEPRPTHEELSASAPVKVSPSCATVAPQVDSSAECAASQTLPTSVAQQVVPKDLGAGAVGSCEHQSGRQSSQSLGVHTSLKAVQPAREQMGGTRALANALFNLSPQYFYPTWVAPKSFHDAVKQQETKRRQLENHRRVEAFINKQFSVGRKRQQEQKSAKQGAVLQPSHVVASAPPQPQAQPQVQALPQVQPQAQVQARPQVQTQPNGQMQPQPIDYTRSERRPDITNTLEYRVIKLWSYQGSLDSEPPTPDLIHMAAQAYAATVGREVTPDDARAIFEMLELMHQRRKEQAKQTKQSNPK